MPRRSGSLAAVNGKGSDPAAESGRSKQRGWRFYLTVALAVLAAIFVLQNTEETDVNFLFAEAQLPLFFALLLAVALGVAIGWLAPKVRRDSKRRDEG